MMYMVVAIKDTYEADVVEVVGIFDIKEKAYKAKYRVAEWMEENGYEYYEVLVNPIKVNHVEWKEVKENI